MSTVTERLDALETQILQFRQDLLTYIKAEQVAQIEAIRDQQVSQLASILASLENTKISLQRGISAMQTQVADWARPKQVTIESGSLTMTIEHNLGRKPVVQVLDSTLEVIDTVTVTHTSSAIFTLTLPSTTFTGYVLYV